VNGKTPDELVRLESFMAYVTNAQKHDIVSVGDVSMDIFIHLPETGIEERIDDSGHWLALPFGAKVLCEQSATVALGGGAANAAVAFARFGLRVALASFLAHDHYGLDLLNALRTEGVETNLVHVDDPTETNRSYILWYGSDRTILAHNQKFNYHWPYLRPSDVPAWIYLTSVGPNSLQYEDQIADWLEANPTVRLAFRPGTAQVGAGAKRLSRLCARAEALVVVEGDVNTFLGRAVSDTGNVIDELLELGARRVVLIGRDGGASGADQERRYTVPPFTDTSPPYERTGADDAFAATVVAALVAGLPFQDALRRAAVNAMSVKHEIGSQAGLLTAEALDAYLDEANDFVVVVQ
jgi:ribokinase